MVRDFCAYAPDDSVGTATTAAIPSRAHSVLAVLWSLGLLAGCDDGSSHMADADPSADQVLESARPDTSVGLTLTVPKFSDGETTFSLADDSNGAFKIDPTTGVVSLAGAVDYEATQERSIVAQAVVVNGGRPRMFKQRFAIAVLDSPAPGIDITFPFTHARYSDPIISVSGRIDHPQPENVVVSARVGADSVNGEVTDDAFSIKDIAIAGSEQFTLTVTASHPGGDTTVQTITLSREPELTDVPRMVLDAARGRIVMVDRYTASVVATPLDGSARVIVSGKYVGTGPALVAPVALTLDTQSDALFVVDDELGALFRVDLATGDRTLISARTRGTGPSLGTPTEMDFDSIRGRVIVSDENQGVLAIDPISGDRRLVSSAASPGPQIYFHRGIGFDAVRDRYLVHDSASLFAVNPVTGARTMLSDWLADPSYGRLFRGMSIASEAGAVFLGEEMSDGVLRIDLSSGLRQQVTSSGLPAPWSFPVVGSGPPLQYSNDVVFDPAQGRLFVMEGEYADPLMEIAANGDRSVIRNAALGAGVNFRSPSGIEYDVTRHTLLVADYVADTVVEIDVASGNRTLIHGPAGGRGSINDDPLDVASHPGTGLFYVVDFQTRSLYSVDSNTAVRVTIADPSTGTGPPLSRPERIEIDAEGNVAYVADSGAVFAVNPMNGERRVLTATSGSARLALDSAHRRLYVADRDGALRVVDLAGGAITQIGGGADISFMSVADIAYDSLTNRILRVDDYPARLYSVDVTTGAKSVVSGQINSVQKAGHGPELIWPRGVTLDAQRRVAFITDDAYDGIIAVDLRTGDRQLIAK